MPRHDAFDDLFLEGLVVLVVVVGARGAGGHHEADAERDRGEAAAPRLSAYDDSAPSEPLASVLRIALFPFKISAGRRRLRGAAPRLRATFSLEGPYRPGSGRFCGGYPQEGIIQ